MSYKRLSHDEAELCGVWYAYVNVLAYSKSKEITFSLWSAIDWASYTAYYVNDCLHFDEKAIINQMNTVETIKKMIDFIHSGEYNNFEEREDMSSTFEI